MSKPNRRDFLKSAVTAGSIVCGLNTETARAGPENILSEDRMGVLVDTPVCIGCRRCEYACKKAHGLPTPPLEDYNDQSVFNRYRRPDVHALTVVNEFENPKNSEKPFHVKVQCMHCDHPACLSACIVGAFSKKEDGAVVWDSDKCIGCRYCLIACPFQIPTFEYGKAIQPDIRKCDFCYERTEADKLPACVEVCPVEALTYGRLYELHKLAHDKVTDHPDRYVNHIYGDFEVGGTSWIYLAGKEFSDLKFPELGRNPAPGVSESIQHGVFAYFVPPLSFYALLGGVMWLTKKKKESEQGGDYGKQG